MEARSARGRSRKDDREPGRLTERVDSPNASLDEDLVLVHYNERSKSLRSQFLEQNRVRRAVTLENFTLPQGLVLSLLSQFLTNSLFVLSECECFRLSEEVGEEDSVVETVSDRVLSFDRSEEIGRNELGTLVDELVESVLSCKLSTKGSEQPERVEGEMHSKKNRQSLPLVPDCPQMIGPVW